MQEVCIEKVRKMEEELEKVKSKLQTEEVKKRPIMNILHFKLQ
jgi:hypothetical protein